MKSRLTINLLLFTAFVLVCLSAGAADAQSSALPCHIASSHTHGCVLTATTGPRSPGPAATGTRVGKACAYNVLRLVAWGDVRVRTAMARGGIAKISSVDYETFELIPYYGFFSAYCTVVSGE